MTVSQIVARVDEASVARGWKVFRPADLSESNAIQLSRAVPEGTAQSLHPTANVVGASARNELFQVRAGFQTRKHQSPNIVTPCRLPALREGAYFWERRRESR